MPCVVLPYPELNILQQHSHWSSVSTVSLVGEQYRRIPLL
jgi:hypothetical protein